MSHFTLRERARYQFDKVLARGPAALIALLALASVAAILIAGAVIVASGAAPAGSEPLPFPEATWQSLMRTLDSGTMGGDTGWAFRAIMLGVTITGIFIISTLIGVLTSGLEDRLEGLRKGRSKVVERGHTVILGWSDEVLAILRELTLANASKRGACVVILGEADAAEMVDTVRERLPDTRGTRVVCRSGSPIEMGDLDLVSIDTARSIIILSPEEHGDTSVIKALLAITNNPGRREAKYHIVAELQDPRNLDAARLVGKDEVELVLVGDLISRIMAQTCRQSGLSVVYDELLSFEGNEFYFHAEPALQGRTFGEALFAYEDCAVMGFEDASGRARFVPPMNTPLAGMRRLILIAEDDDSIRLRPSGAPVDEAAIALRPAPPPAPERTLILGWSGRTPGLIRELDGYVPPASTVLVVASEDDAEAGVAALQGALTRQTTTFRAGDPTDRRTLDALDVPSFDHVITLSSDTLDMQQADARTLVTLLHLRDIADKAPRAFSIVSEMLDLKNRQLAEVTRADDFIVSNTLASLVLAQVSETKALNAVFAELFSPEGAEIHLEAADCFVRPGAEVAFATLVEAGRRAGKVAIGYRKAALMRDATRAYGVVVNPAKATRLRVEPGDKLIVAVQGR